MGTSLRHQFTKLCFALSLTFTTPIASAIPVNGVFEATVTEGLDAVGLFGLVGFDVYRGMTIRVDFSYDTATAPGALVAGPSAIYLQNPAAPDWLTPTVTLNGVSYSDLDLSGFLPNPAVPVPKLGRIDLINDNAGLDEFFLRYSPDWAPGFGGLPPNESFLYSLLDIYVTDPTETMLSSTDLPTSVDFTDPAAQFR